MTALRTAAAAATLLAATPAFAARKGLAPGEQIDLNRATVAELMRLPSVGEQKARRVVEHRQKHPFRRPEDVLQVKGFGKAWFQRMKGHLTAGAPAGSPAAPAAPPGARPAAPPAPAAAGARAAAPPAPAAAPVAARR